ncbi:sulfonate ABC transporter substrate-binding protein [Mesorhizobium amorphae]|uniref:ABC transporter substrate-binding protein n=1 Tax=Mesorhizobium amorphae TaxID=71433 RepID=UPI00235D69F1|nr:ABC transporter substrate-binding protein [Mesorhizobium amorphae]GLR45685.1 sulfonate ABC transporter substrate-binding protein [Mesorhizobium amorphae]
MKITRRSLLAGAPLAAGVVVAGVPCFAFAEAAPVKFRYLASRGGISPHELADELGYYKGLGVELENVGYVGGGPESLFALASGNVDIGSAATPAVINSISGGNDFVAAYPSNGINKDVRSVFYVLEDSPIKSIADIAGKTISVNTLGAHLDYTVREALHSVGLPPDAANLVVVPGPQLEQTLRSRQVDIAGLGYWQATFAGALVDHGGVRGVFNDTDVLGEIAGGFVVLRRDFIAANSDAARNFVEQSARASDWSQKNPDEARKVLADILNRRGENGDLARYWTGFGLREKAQATDRDIDFWVSILERDGRLGKGKLKAADILYRSGETKTN